MDKKKTEAHLKPRFLYYMALVARAVVKLRCAEMQKADFRMKIGFQA
jgi:hypothetical protein